MRAIVKILYSNEKLKEQCNSLSKAQALFGGDKVMAVKLLSRVNVIENAEVIKDIILMPPLRFHALTGDRAGFFAADVKTRKEPWRIILRPLDENGEAFVTCNIDEIAMSVRAVEIKEVSRHYE